MFDAIDAVVKPLVVGVFSNAIRAIDEDVVPACMQEIDRNAVGNAIGKE